VPAIVRLTGAFADFEVDVATGLMASPIAAAADTLATRWKGTPIGSDMPFHVLFEITISFVNFVTLQ